MYLAQMIDLQAIGVLVGLIAGVAGGIFAASKYYDALYSRIYDKQITGMIETHGKQLAQIDQDHDEFVKEIKKQNDFLQEKIVKKDEIIHEKDILTMQQARESITGLSKVTSLMEKVIESLREGNKNIVAEIVNNANLIKEENKRAILDLNKTILDLSKELNKYKAND